MHAAISHITQLVRSEHVHYHQLWLQSINGITIGIGVITCIRKHERSGSDLYKDQVSELYNSRTP